MTASRPLSASAAFGHGGAERAKRLGAGLVAILHGEVEGATGEAGGQVAAEVAEADEAVSHRD